MRNSDEYFRLDYCGIAILIIGSIVPLLYYQFYCEFGTKIIYLSLIGLLGIACIVISMWDRFSSSDYRVYRACKYIFERISIEFSLFL
jgi:adiponectin receptor